MSLRFPVLNVNRLVETEDLLDAYDVLGCDGRVQGVDQLLPAGCQMHYGKPDDRNPDQGGMSCSIRLMINWNTRSFFLLVKVTRQVAAFHIVLIPGSSWSLRGKYIVQLSFGVVRVAISLCICSVFIFFVTFPLSKKVGATYDFQCSMLDVQRQTFKGQVFRPL
jgi:hypothetical protein